MRKVKYQSQDWENYIFMLQKYVKCSSPSCYLSADCFWFPLFWFIRTTGEICQIINNPYYLFSIFWNVALQPVLKIVLPTWAVRPPPLSTLLKPASNSIKPPCCIFNSAATSCWESVLTGPEDPRGLRRPRICRSSRNLPGRVDKAPSHSAASERNSPARGNYRGASGARWSAGRDNLCGGKVNKMEAERQTHSEQNKPPQIHSASNSISSVLQVERSDLITDNPAGRSR